MKFLVCLLILGVVVSGEDDDEMVATIADELWEWKMQISPNFASTMGVKSSRGYFRNLTTEAFDDQYQFARALNSKLNNISFSKLNTSQRINAEILKAMTQQLEDGYRFLKHSHFNPINFLEASFLNWEMTLTSFKFETEEDIANYTAGLLNYANFMEQKTALMSLSIAANTTLHNVSITPLVNYLADIGQVETTETTFYKPCSNASESVKGNCSKAVQKVQQVLATLKNFLEKEYIPNTRSNVSVSSLPDGKEYYRECVKFHLTTDMSPEEVHRIGWEELKRIEKEMKEILQKRNFTGTIKDFYAEMSSDRTQFLQSPEEYLEKAKNMITEMIEKSKKLFNFDADDEVPLEIEEMPFNGPLASYYEPTDNYPKGKIFINLRNIDKHPISELPALLAHEAIPGHHFQLSTQYKLKDVLPKFRRNLLLSSYYGIPFEFPPFTAYVEGWGLYAEYLGHELGFYKTDFEQFSAKSFEMWRALRLLIDTGIHWMGWTRERSINMMQQYLGISNNSIQVEVDRYITWPGQALAYKIGELRLKALRKQAAAELGSKFNATDFHKNILEAGAVPMKLLDKIVEWWIINNGETGSGRCFCLQ